MSQLTKFIASSGPGSGTVTSVTGGTGINITGVATINPTVNLDVPVVIANGGTNAITFATTDGTVYFDGTRLVTTATGTIGQVLTSGGAGVAPAYATPAASSISITGNSGGALVGNAFTFTGGTTGLTFSGAVSTETLTGTLVVANGGTGSTAFNINGVVVSGATTTTPLTSLTLANGQIVIGATGAAPLAATLTAGTNISITNAANSITIAATGATSFSWSVIVADQTAVVNNGYFCNKAGTLALLLPAASAVGDTVEVVNINTATGTQITQAAGQQIFISTASTTLGAAGTLTSSALGDSLRLVCSVANTTWRVVSMIGNWTPA